MAKGLKETVYDTPNLCFCCGHSEVKTTVLPSTKVTRESSMKNIVLIRCLSTVHPNIVIPPGFICKYNTATQQSSIISSSWPVWRKRKEKKGWNNPHRKLVFCDMKTWTCMKESGCYYKQASACSDPLIPYHFLNWKSERRRVDSWWLPSELH